MLSAISPELWGLLIEGALPTNQVHQSQTFTAEEHQASTRPNPLSMSKIQSFPFVFPMVHQLHLSATVIPWPVLFHSDGWDTSRFHLLIDWLHKVAPTSVHAATAKPIKPLLQSCDTLTILSQPHMLVCQSTVLQYCYDNRNSKIEFVVTVRNPPSP